MASSFIEFQNNGFWIRDGILEPATSYLYLQIYKYEPKEKWLTEMGEHIKYNSWGYFKGFMNLRLDKYLNDEQHRELFLELVNKTINELKKKDAILDVVADLNLVLDSESRKIYSSSGNLQRDRVILVLTYIQRLINRERIDDSPQSPTMAI